MTKTTEYLLALYIAEHQQSPPIAPGEIASSLGRSPAAATEMLQRLADDALVFYEPYEGATLTPEGHDTAANLHQAYVTLSWFFRVVLELDNHEQEAMEMAGAISPTVAERLVSTLPVDEEVDFQRAESGSPP